MQQEVAQAAQAGSVLAGYWQALGIQLALWLPIVGLFYLAVRLGFKHGALAAERAIDREWAQKVESVIQHRLKKDAA